jgi:hypothetical protein
MNKNWNITKRSILIDAIIEYAWDEFNSRDSLINLAKKSESELYDELQSIENYFKENNLERKEDITKILQSLLLMQ